MDPQAPDVTQIPVTDANAPVEDTPEVAPVPDVPSPDAVPDVPGTPVDAAPQAEATAVLPEQAPNPVPATAEPSQDAVTINTHLENVQNQLQAVVDYCNNFLQSHPVAETVVADVMVLVDTVKQALNL